MRLLATTLAALLAPAAGAQVAPPAAHATRSGGEASWTLALGVCGAVLEEAVGFGSIGALAGGADGSLYVGGTFDAVSGTRAANLARWTGQVWEPVGGGLDGTVYALAVGPHVAGRHEAHLEAAGFPIGVYLVRLEAGGQAATRAVTLLR